MELLYIWIENYKGLSEIGINLSNQFRFDFNAGDNTLNIRTTNNFIPSFFAENISNFTGIIGVNSAGKTSILRYILEYCSDGIHYETETARLIIFKQKDRFYYFSNENITIIPQHFKELFEKAKNLDLLKRNKTTVYLSSHFDPTSFYSNDHTKIQLGKNKNLSTWYLLHTDIQFRKNIDTNRKDISFDDRVSAFASREFIRIVQLLRWMRMDEPSRNPFLVKTIPPYLNISLYFNTDTPNRKQFESLAEKLQKYFKVRNRSKNIFLLRAFEAAIFHFIDEGRSVIGSEEIKDQYQQIYSHVIRYLDKTHPYTQSSSASIITDINSLCYDIAKAFPAFNDHVSDIMNFIKSLDDFIQRQQARLHDNGNVLTLRLSSIAMNSLMDFVDAFYKTERIGTFAEFYFSHQPGYDTSLSSGEYAILSLFGRLNSIKIDIYKPILLLIDEAELALHPQWQKQFISVFINFISERFKGHQVQVVLTSHSPFILSDLPPHCVVLLKKDDNSTKVVDNLDAQKETFGANIHELFTDSFFLQDGLMGEFAREKIEKLIEDIKSETAPITLNKYNSVYKSRVNIIGERFLKTKILELIATNAEFNAIDAIINTRTEELRILNEIRNKKYDQN